MYPWILLIGEVISVPYYTLNTSGVKIINQQFRIPISWLRAMVSGLASHMPV